MARFCVQVIGKKPVETNLPAELPMPASPYALMARPTHEKVEVVFPNICPCCGGEVEAGSTLEVSKIKGWGGYTPITLDNWQVPYCRACLEHIALKQHRPSSSVIIEIAMLLAILIVVFSLLNTNPFLGAILFLAILAAGFTGNAWILRRYEQENVRPSMKSNCVSPAPAITCHGWDSEGTKHRFLILNESYAKAFAQANHSQFITPIK